MVKKHIKVGILILALALVCGAAWANWMTDDEEFLLLLKSSSAPAVGSERVAIGGATRVAIGGATRVIP